MATLISEQTDVLEPPVALRTFRIACPEPERHLHAIEVAAGSRYETVARNLRAFRDADRAGVIGQEAAL
jgi:hypothetical protein